MYIGNRHWKHTLEKYIGNIAGWKHNLHLETKSVYWKHNMDIGNIRIRLETYSAYWKHHFHLETHIYWKHITKHR